MSNPSLPKQHFLDSFEEGRLAEWLSSQGKNITYGLIALIAVLIIFYRFSTSHTSKQEQDYIQAAQDFTLFTNSHASDAASTEALQRLTAVMSSHPELHAAYDGTIAQTLLDKDKVSEAKPFALSTLARTRSDELPFYADFAATTLLIGEQQYQQALDKAQALQQQMIEELNKQTDDERSFGTELFAINLFRIGMLQQQLGNHAAEARTWKEWKQYAGLENGETLPAKVDTQAFRAVIQELAIGSFSLPDYIAYREKALMELKK